MGPCVGKPNNGAGLQSVNETSSPVKGTSSLSAREAPVCAQTSDVKSLKSDRINRSQFIMSNRGTIREVYKMENRTLGEGAYGSVSKGVHKTLNVARAIKTMSKASVKHVRRFQQEIQILKDMDHPNIIKLFETFEDDRNFSLVMELCTGGELLDRIVEAGHFTEKDAAAVVQQMLSAVFYMHKNGVCHRDLKPENFLFFDKGPINKNILKMIDFGLSARFEESGPVLHTKAGTPYYVAPEVLQGEYDQACDLWSCGVIMYTMLCGHPPFYGKTDNEVLRKVKKGIYSFDHKCWKHISQDAKTLIGHLLKYNPKERYTAEQALKHPWIRDCAPRAESTSIIRDDMVRNLRSFRSQSKLKKAALNIIAGQMSEDRILELRAAFKALDVNGEGLLTLEELQIGMVQAKFDTSKFNMYAIMEGVDADGSGLIDYTEFLAATLDKKLYLQRDACWAAFCVFDQDNNGQISLTELREILETGSVGEVLDQDGRTTEDILLEVDKNGDGSIDFDEFLDMMKGGGSMSLPRASDLTPKLKGGKSPGSFRSRHSGGKFLAARGGA